MKPRTPIGWKSWEDAKRDLERWEREGSAEVRPHPSDNAPTKLNPLKDRGE